MKSYTYAQTKRHQKGGAADSVQPECSRPTSEQPHISTRQNTPIFKSKERMCDLQQQVVQMQSTN